MKNYWVTKEPLKELCIAQRAKCNGIAAYKNNTDVLIGPEQKLISGKSDREVQKEFTNYCDASMESKYPDIDVLFIDAVRPEPHAMVFYGWVNKGRKLLSLSGQKYRCPQKILIIFDRVFYRYPKQSVALVNESVSLILVHLAACFPKLNLIQHIWKYFKEQAFYNNFYINIRVF